jgi:hypothetical protein
MLSECSKLFYGAFIGNSYQVFWTECNIQIKTINQCKVIVSLRQMNLSAKVYVTRTVWAAAQSSIVFMGSVNGIGDLLLYKAARNLIKSPKISSPHTRVGRKNRFHSDRLWHLPECVSKYIQQLLFYDFLKFWALLFATRIQSLQKLPFLTIFWS